MTMSSSIYWQEPFSSAERDLLSRYFTEIDGPVCVLINLPEVVKGALFARYSRSPKSLRRLFLDEFIRDPDLGIEGIAKHIGEEGPVNTRRAISLYERIFTEYGDDSVAQLGAVHIACEQASNILTKVLEWGRLAAYLEQSTRYIYYDSRLRDRYRYFIPDEIAKSALLGEYVSTLDYLFDTYRDLVPRLSAYYETRYPIEASESSVARKATLRAKVCDDLRGLLPAATLSNLGIFANGQALEALLLRMRSHSLEEVRQYASLILKEVRKVVPAFVRRVDLPDRGQRWTRYFSDIAQEMSEYARSFAPPEQSQPEVVLTEWDPDAEVKMAAAALYAYTDLPDAQLVEIVRGMSPQEQARLLRIYIGSRENRRHRPGRAFERSYYRFDILGDYGMFRDLQRHRMLTLEWQRLSPKHGYDVPGAICDVDAEDEWRSAIGAAASLHGRVADTLGAEVAQYVVPFAFKVRFYFHLNAREAFHLLELRTSSAGHSDYRRVCQEMHRLIREKAGHKILADAMNFVDHNTYDLGRLDAERRAAARKPVEKGDGSEGC